MSSLLQVARDNAIKAVVGVLAAGLLTGSGAWVRGKIESIVTRSDLEQFAEMIGDEVGAQIEPLARQQAINTTAICTGRRATLKAAIRDLKVEIAQMQREQSSPDWTEYQTRLLSEWEEDFDDAQEELNGLDCH